MPYSDQMRRLESLRYAKYTLQDVIESFRAGYAYPDGEMGRAQADLEVAIPRAVPLLNTIRDIARREGKPDPKSPFGKKYALSQSTRSKIAPTLARLERIVNTAASTYDKSPGKSRAAKLDEGETDVQGDLIKARAKLLTAYRIALRMSIGTGNAVTLIGQALPLLEEGVSSTAYNRLIGAQRLLSGAPSNENRVRAAKVLESIADDDILPAIRNGQARGTKAEAPADDQYVKLVKRAAVVFSGVVTQWNHQHAIDLPGIRELQALAADLKREASFYEVGEFDSAVALLRGYAADASSGASTSPYVQALQKTSRMLSVLQSAVRNNPAPGKSRAEKQIRAEGASDPNRQKAIQLWGIVTGTLLNGYVRRSDVDALHSAAARIKNRPPELDGVIGRIDSVLGKAFSLTPVGDTAKVPPAIGAKLRRLYNALYRMLIYNDITRGGGGNAVPTRSRRQNLLG